MERRMGDEALYKKMMTSPGGVMLLVRLGADLGLMAKEDLERLSITEGAADLIHKLPAGSRLLITIEWLDRQFGRPNCIRAIVETSSEVLVARRMDATTIQSRDVVSA